MALVKLHNAFFAPNGELMKPGVRTVPDEWELPKGTEVLEEEELPAPTRKSAAAK